MASPSSISFLWLLSVPVARMFPATMKNPAGAGVQRSIQHVENIPLRHQRRTVVACGFCKVAFEGGPNRTDQIGVKGGQRILFFMEALKHVRPMIPTVIKTLIALIGEIRGA